MNPYIFRTLIFPWYHQLKKTGVMKKLRALEKNQWEPQEVLEQLQEDKLNRLLKHAKPSRTDIANAERKVKQDAESEFETLVNKWKTSIKENEQ